MYADIQLYFIPWLITIYAKLSLIDIICTTIYLEIFRFSELPWLFKQVTNETCPMLLDKVQSRAFLTAKPQP